MRPNRNTVKAALSSACSLILPSMKALGAERINLFGGSYGTRAALEYMRRFPERTRTAVLRGVAGTSFDLPLGFARSSQAALDDALGDCEADSACTPSIMSPSLARTYV